MIAAGFQRPFIEEEFVGRDEALGILLKIARQQSARRVLVLLGPFGIGKSWLLQKLEVDRQEEGVDPVLVDFAAPPLGRPEWGYLDIVETVRSQLGGPAFDELAAIIDTARRESEGLGLPDPFATQLGGAATGVAPGGPGAGPIDARVSEVGPGAQVAVGAQISMAQRDVNLYVVNQATRATEQIVPQHHQAHITEAFQRALLSVVATRRVTFLFDAWLKATTPTRDWVCRTVVRWILDQTLGRAAAVMSDDAAVPELQARHPRVYAYELPRLSEPEVVAYWVERRHLDPAAVSWVVPACLGHPLTLAMIADQHELSAEV